MLHSAPKVPDRLEDWILLIVIGIIDSKINDPYPLRERIECRLPVLIRSYDRNIPAQFVLDVPNLIQQHSFHPSWIVQGAHKVDDFHLC